MHSRYNVTTSLEVNFLVTSRTCRGQGVGTLVVRGAELVAQSRGIPLCTAICSNIGTERICLDHLGWDNLLTVPKSEFSYGGIRMDKLTGEHKNLVLVAKKVL
jgi:GNAT superfamily N-acetyltransferase